MRVCPHGNEEKIETQCQIDLGQHITKFTWLVCQRCMVEGLMAEYGRRMGDRTLSDTLS